MGNHLSTNPIGWPPLVWGQTSRHGRLLLKKGGNFTISQLNNSWTPQNLEHNVGNHKGLLVANDEEGCHRIHQRMQHMPVKEKPTEQTKATPFSHHIRHLRYTIHFYSHGLHHQTSPFRILRHHTYDHRHFFKSFHLHSLQRNH